MSTLAYAFLTTARDAARPGTSIASAEGSSPGVATYVDALAALVPAEVLTAHAAILTFTTEAMKDGENPAVKIVDLPALKLAFWALLGLSSILYIVGRMMPKPGGQAQSLDRWDVLRALLPPASFVAWCMLQKATAFDAVVPVAEFSSGMRGVTAIIAAIVLGLLAAFLAFKADARS